MRVIVAIVALMAVDVVTKRMETITGQNAMETDQNATGANSTSQGSNSKEVQEMFQEAMRTTLKTFNDVKTEFSKIGDQKRMCEAEGGGVGSIDYSKLPEASSVLATQVLQYIEEEEEKKCTSAWLSFLQQFGAIHTGHAFAQQRQDQEVGPQLKKAHEEAQAMERKLISILDSTVASKVPPLQGSDEVKNLALPIAETYAALFPQYVNKFLHLELPDSRILKGVQSALVEVSATSATTTPTIPPVEELVEKEEELVEGVVEKEEELVKELVEKAKPQLKALQKVLQSRLHRGFGGSAVSLGPVLAVTAVLMLNLIQASHGLGYVPPGGLGYWDYGQGGYNPRPPVQEMKWEHYSPM